MGAFLVVALVPRVIVVRCSQVFSYEDETTRVVAKRDSIGRGAAGEYIRACTEVKIRVPGEMKRVQGADLGQQRNVCDLLSAVLEHPHV
jgi:hypothetical protein